MRELNICPSTLQEGFSTYSPTALKQLFDGQPVSHILDFDSPNNESADNEAYVKNVGRISLSGVQPKASLVVNQNNQLVKPAAGEHGTYILKPAPTSYALYNKGASANREGYQGGHRGNWRRSRASRHCGDRRCNTPAGVRGVRS